MYIGVHLVVHRLIWCPRCRKPVLVRPIAGCCQVLLEQTCAEHQGDILTLAIQPDHVHLFVRVGLTDSASDVVKERKGVTSFSLRRECPLLRRLPSM